MSIRKHLVFLLAVLAFVVVLPSSANAALTLTAGSNATTTPSVATSITGFQIVGPSASTTPVKLRATSGTLALSTVSGVTMSGNGSGTVNLSGTVANLNTALSTLTYTRSSTGTDTLEVSLVSSNEVFFADNGHLYSFVSGSYTWDGAKTAAETQTAYGASGYLATITSSAENNFVYTRISGDGWLGATDTQVEKNWRWMTGPEAGTSFFQENASGGGGSAISGRYNAWASGEPNDYGSGEDCGYMYSSQSGAWNDFPCSATQGYVVEFGADGNLPTVVAANISVTTADVPAITSLSPANGVTSASPSANLVIGFSKTVTKQTGNILIRKSSDSTLVETIDASGALVSGSGTNTITINPSADLAEGTQFYVIVPSTAFKDSSNNFFDGISSSSTWVFTTSDVTAPVVSARDASVSSSSATATWTTNESASSKVIYSVDTLYASTTATSDTSPRVTSHSVSLSNLLSCTAYNYKVVSGDASGNIATSTNSTFTTTGCAGSTIPVSATSTSVTVSSGGTTNLTQGNSTLTVTTPSNVTSQSSTLVIQIQALSGTSVLDSLGIPTAKNKVGDIVFEVKAIINSSTVLDSFDSPVTIAYQYADSDIVGLNESTLLLYHYHNGSWSALDSCSVDAPNNTITCTTPSFSIFSLFGQTLSSGRTSSGKRLVGCRDQKASNYNYFSTHDQSLCEYKKIASTKAFQFTRDLKKDMTGSDVLELQKFLNSRGYVLAKTGPGSVGNESATFGGLTKSALIKYQKDNNISPSAGYFGPITRKVVNLSK